VPWFSYLTDGTAAGTVVAGGRRTRGSAFATVHMGRFGLEGEVLRNEARVRRDLASADLTQTAFSLTGDFVVTGEPSTAGGPVPHHDFDPDLGHWGAVMLAARVSQLSVSESAFPVYADPARSARRATAWGVSAGWYITRLTRAQVAYEQTHFAGGAASGNRPTIRLLELRLQFVL
jgi:phosphate-selective porin OprO/OprP